jgi:hypothetical protein
LNQYEIEKYFNKTIDSIDVKNFISKLNQDQKIQINSILDIIYSNLYQFKIDAINFMNKLNENINKQYLLKSLNEANMNLEKAFINNDGLYNRNW